MGRLPTLKQLRFFVSLEKNCHFGKAAKECFVAQPTFSVAIKTLEDILGSKLVDRDNKNVIITPLGIEVAKRARKILAGAEELSNITFSRQQPLTGQLRLGIIPTIAPFTLPKLLPRIHKEYPQLDLYIKEDLTLNVYQDMMRGELDLILIALPYQLENVDEVSLFRDHFCLPVVATPGC